MRFLHILLLASSMLAHTAAFAQNQAAEAGIIVGPGSSLTIGRGVEVSVTGGDMHVQKGALLVQNGQLYVGGDLIVDGTLQTTLGGTDEHPEYGRITVAGEAEYRGSLAVALARGASFQKPQDFTLATFTTGFGTLTARQLPGARWSAQHRDSSLVVQLKGGDSNSAEEFKFEIDAAPLDQKVIIDWVAYFDDRSEVYVVERYEAEAGWVERGRVTRVAEETSAAYYSTVDSDLPKHQSVLRYRVRLVDAQGAWHYSEQVAVYIGQDSKLRVFPNPVVGTQARVLGFDESRKLKMLRLLGTDGRVVHHYPASNQPMQLIEIPPQLVSGGYIIEVLYEDGFRQNTQVVVVR